MRRIRQSDGSYRYEPLQNEIIHVEDAQKEDDSAEEPEEQTQK